MQSPYGALRLSSGLRVLLGEILTLAFVLSNSDNIYFLAFLEPKTTENGQLALWHLVNRLVPEKTYKNTSKCRQSKAKWILNKHGTSKIIDTFSTYQAARSLLGRLGAADPADPEGWGYKAGPDVLPQEFSIRSVLSLGRWLV